MAKEPFTSFKPEDFEIEATQKNDKDRTELFRKILVALKPKLNNRFQNALTYTNKAGKQGTKKGKKKEYRDHTWFSLFFGDPNDEEARDTLQFQVSLNVLGTSAFINCDGSSGEYRKDLFALFNEHKEECFRFLKNLDDDWFVSISANKNKTKKFKATGLSGDEWNISKMQPQDMDLIIKYMGFPGADLSIGKSFSKEETLGMKTGILNEFSDTFEKLLPVYDYLTEQNSPESQILSGKYLLLRNLEESKWDDVSAKKYHFSRSLPNGGPDQMRPGTKAIWFDREDQNIYFVGYGTISKIEDLTDGSNNAVFDDFNTFEKEYDSLERDGMLLKKGTSEIFEKIKKTTIDGGNTWSDNNSMIRTTKEIYEEITNDRDSNLDKKFEEWLKRGARKAGQSIEDYAKDLGKEEIEDRHKKFSELKKVLDEEPIDLTKISPVLKEALAEHPTWMTLEPLEGNEISDAITALKKYKDETNIHSFLSIMNQAKPPGREGAGKSERRTGLETAQNLLIASVCLTALHPSKFVDFRENRWQNLAKLIRIEDEFAPVKTCLDTKRLEEVGKFAKTITETPTFKKYWGNQQEPLWTLAGICWRVKGDKPEGGDTNMDELVEEILQMEEYKLAIGENVVKRIIRHLRGGKNVVLVGAPGVGKTELAKKILKIVGKEDNGTEKFVERVAHAEWTKFHVTGGLNVKDEFVPGCVTLAAQEKKWLLIDEFNRADINKAFGEMFLGIESNTIQLTPEEAKGRSGVEKDNVIINIPEKFRMVCTMNDYDKNLLLTELSFGLITRFAFVDIKPNEEEELDSIKAQLYKDRKINSNDYEKCKGVVEKFYDFIKAVRAAKHERMIGVRTCVDVFRYVVSASKEEGKINAVVFLDEALCDYVLPQFDRLDKHVIESAIVAAKDNLPAELLVKGDKKPSIFYFSLKKNLTRLKQLTSWFDDKSDDGDDDLGIGKTSKSNVDAKKKNYSPRAYKAHDTMKGHVKTNNIEWARKNPKNYYAKQIFKNNPKKSKKK